MSARDLSALDRDMLQGLGRIIQEAFDPDNGGGLACDIKAYGSEGATSFFRWDYSEDKCFIQRTTTDTAPGRLIYVQHLGSAMAVDENIQGMQIRSRATGKGVIAGGTDGAEIKAGMSSDADTGTIAQARAVIANVDAKKGVITTAHLVEAQADIGSGGQITTLKGVRASLNNSGTLTNSYAFVVETANVLYPWKYGLYIASGQATYPIDVTQNVLTADGNTQALNVTVTSEIARTGNELRGINVNLTPLTAVDSYYVTGARVNISGGAASNSVCVRGMIVSASGFSGGISGDFYGLYVYANPGADPAGGSSILRLESSGATGGWLDAFILTATTTNKGPINFLYMISGDCNAGKRNGSCSNQDGYLKVQWGIYTKYIAMYDTLT